jgi:EAL domain-containing protein (putative c-di-GMP-specific phosphodiesterase class I)
VSENPRTAPTAIEPYSIDIEFVTDILTNRAYQAVVRAIISLASAFDLETVAEGVEDAATWDYLRSVGVDFGRCYHLGRPAPLSSAR